MAKRIGGSRRKSRHKLKKYYKDKGKLNLTKYFQEFKPGDNVSLIPDPTYQKGMFHTRFHGKAGVIKRKLKTNYEVVINDRGKTKLLIIHPVHLEKM